MLLGQCLELGFDELYELRLRLQRLLEVGLLRRELLLLAADLHLLELRQVPQLQLEDRLRLHVGQLEAFHENRLRLFLGADDLDDRVDVQIRNQQAFQDVQRAA